MGDYDVMIFRNEFSDGVHTVALYFIMLGLCHSQYILSYIKSQNHNERSLASISSITPMSM